MAIIQCAENCKFQLDGYCSLDKCSNVNSLENACPHYVSRLPNISEGMPNIVNPDKSN